MSTPDFFFGLEISSQGASVDLLGALAAHVVGHVGARDAAVPELTDALRQAVEKGAAAGARRCDIQFRARGASLDILVSANGGRIWQTTLTIP